MKKNNSLSPKFAFIICAGLTSAGLLSAVTHHQWLITESKKECPLILRDTAQNCPAIK